jgi:hypothetical protein
MQNNLKGEDQRRALCEIVAGFERNIDRPCNFKEFEERLQLMASGQNTELRLSWAPEIDRYELGADLKPIIGKRYAIYFIKEHMGWRVYRPNKVGDVVLAGDWKFHSYVKPGMFHSDKDFEVRAERDGHKLKVEELWAKDIKVEQVAYPRWVIEERVPDAIAKLDWESQRKEFQGLTLIDWLGDFPKAGLWKPRLVICTHSDDCCEERAAGFGFCYGHYRDPDEKDLIAVQKAIREREEMPLTHDKDGKPNEAAIRREERKTMDEIAEGARRARDLDKEIILNAITPTLNAHLFPSVDMGAKNYPEHLRIPAGHKLVLTESEIKAQQAKASFELAGGIECQD